MSLVRTAAQILADVERQGDDARPRPGPSAHDRALARLAQEYPDRYRELHEEERQAAKASRKADVAARIRELVAQKLTDNQIGARLGVHRGTVQKLRRAHGIPSGLGRVGRPPGGKR